MNAFRNNRQMCSGFEMFNECNFIDTKLSSLYVVEILLVSIVLSRHSDFSTFSFDLIAHHTERQMKNIG